MNSWAKLNCWSWATVLFAINFFYPYLQAGTQVQFLDRGGVKFVIENKPLSIHDVLEFDSQSTFTSTNSFHPNFGFSLNTYWFHITLKNFGKFSESVIFEVAYPRLEILEFYAVNAQNDIIAEYLTGTNRPILQRVVDHNNFAFPLDIAAGETVRIFMRTFTQNPLRFPVRIWEPEAFRGSQQFQTLIQGLYFGGIVTMVIYNMFVFFSTRNRSYLYYCLFVSCAASYLASDGGLFLHYVFTESGYINDKITLLSIFGANLFGIYFVLHFLRLRETDPAVYRYKKWVLPPVLISGSAIFFLPYHAGGIFYTLLSTVTSVILIVLTLRGLIRKQREAYFYAVAWLCLLIGTIAYGLLSMGFIEPTFFTERGLQIGSFAEVTILSFALADRLNQLRKSLKIANDKLAYQIENVEEQVLIKTRDIRSIMEHIPIGVFSIIPGLKIHKDYSQSMKALFHTQNIEGQDALNILFAQALITGDQKRQMEAALATAIGEERFCFETNRHCFLDQVVVEFEGIRKNLSLLWNPVCTEEGLIEKILVTVHDITRLQTLEYEAEHQKQELKIIQQILEVPAQRFQSFLRQSEQWLIDSKRLLVLLGQDAIKEKCLHVIMMNIHSLKGTARTLFFHAVSDRAHHVEEHIQALLKRGAEPEMHLYLQSELDKLQELIDQYRSIATEKLGRRLVAVETIELNTNLLHDILLDLSSIHHKYQNNEVLSSIRSLETVLFRHLDEVLAECLKSSDRLAEELGKQSPNILIEAEEFGVTSAGYDMLIAILTHMLRNSMDHGIETPELRQKKAKPLQGTIGIKARVEGEFLTILFYDDGQGLDLGSLKAQGLHRGLISQCSSLNEIAELIFVPDLSTRETVSNLSGRGVGLSAVRETLQKEGGKVQLVLSSDATEDGFHSFHLRLSLPKKFWTELHRQPVPLSA